MILLRFATVACAALSFFIGAGPVHAYVTPDEFVDDGGAPEDGGGEIGDVPLPTLNPPPQSSSSSSSSSTPSPAPAPSPSPKKGGGGAPVLQLLPEERKKWDAREEERLELRMNSVHSAAPEAPHNAADSLPTSGLPVDVLFVSSLLGGTALIYRKKIVFLIVRSHDS